MSESPEGFNPEQKEEEKKSPIFIIYRDNDLFQKQIPEMVKILSAMGRQVEVQSFPKETGEEEIEEWYKENKGLLAGKEIISDRTACIPWEMKEEIFSTGAKIVDNIDNLLSDAMGRAIFSNEYKKVATGIEFAREAYEEEFSECYSAMINKILANPENIPSKVFIFPDHIIDHSNLDDTRKAYEELRSSSHDKQKEIIDEATKVVMEKFKEWLTIGGINPEKIEIGNEKNIKEIDNSNGWVIIDRHAGNMVREIKSIKSIKCLELPEGDFYRTAREGGLLDYTDEEFVEAFSKVLEEKLSDKKEPA